MSQKDKYMQACDVTKEIIGLNLEFDCDSIKCKLCPMWVSESKCCISHYLQSRLDNLIYKN